MQVDFDDAPNSFYLGARVDAETHEVMDDAPVTYEPRDLTTHGVIVGMTGSGKSGLGMVLLEEAALDGIPQIVVDPKGDMTNMLLAFDDITVEHFRPWVNPEDVPQGGDVDEYAREVAREWREGLQQWGIGSARVAAYRRASRFAIYTPGSEAGLPVSVLASFARPAEGWEGNEEALRERISGLVTALLGLIGVQAEPLEDPEHILLSNIFEYNWRNNADLSMANLILHVQDPPFTKLGVLDVDTVIAEADRLKLAKQLNNIISAPSFQSWTEGQPLDIPSLLYTDEGTPQTSIFYIAHLSQAEQHFIVALLLENILSWMNTLSGTSKLRTIVYVDEVFGMFPPHPQNPSTKGPLMRLLKQGRAFGVGALLATQNAKDIDYKGLSNAGTWWIGKLQTENDRSRVLEGLDTASRANSSFNVGQIGDLIGRLRPREFVMHDVHREDTPLLMRSRWAMSYLRGPLTKHQVSDLMADQRREERTPEPQAPPNMAGSRPTRDMRGRMGRVINPRKRREDNVEPSDRAHSPTYSGERQVGAHPSAGEPVTREAAPPGFTPARPSLPSSIEEYFLPTEFTFDQALRQWQRRTRQPLSLEGQEQLLYIPSLLAQVTVRFTHRKTNSVELLWYAFIVPNLPRMAHIDWELYQAEPFDPNTLELKPFREAYYADIPPALLRGSSFTNLRDSLTEWIYNNLNLTILHNPAVGLYNALDESRREFMMRVQDEARARRDEQLEQIAETYERRFDRFEDRIQNVRSRLDAEEEEEEGRKLVTAATTWESALRIMRGNLYRTISQVARSLLYQDMTEEQTEVYQEDLMNLQQDVEETEAEMEEAMEEARRRWAEAVNQIEEVPVRPNKKDITPALYGIGWVPYWGVQADGTSHMLPASTSRLTEQQIRAQQDVEQGRGTTGTV